jgi:hypothetical protein
MFARAVFAFAVLATSLFAAETHAIKLLRPVKAGDRFDITAKVAYEDSMKTSFDGREVESDETVVACRMTGALTVVAVTKKGLPSALRLKVKTVECVRGGQPAGIFNEGDELFLRRDEPENESQVNGEAADDIQAQLIESLLSVQAEGEVSDEDIFGTSDKVAVGAEWPVNAKAAVASLARSGVTGLDPAGVSLTNLPENVKGRRFHSEYTVEMDVPVDPTSTAGRTKGMAKLEVDAAGTEEFDGKKIEVAVKINRRVASEIIATPGK